MKYHALFVILKKRQNLKMSSAANYRWRVMGLNGDIMKYMWTLHRLTAHVY